MTAPYLTKSDFKVGLDCLHKLKYKKAKYPSKLNENEYLQFFADCGFMVEAMAHALYPSGRTPSPQPGETLAEATARQFDSSADSVWFEPTFIHDGYSARIDMMIREGSILRLIEIKAKSFDPEEDNSMWKARDEGIRSEWESYLFDVAFQTMVVRAANPNFEVRPELCLVDKSKTCSEANLFEKFRFLERDDADRSAPRAEFVGDVELLKNDHLLVFVDVGEYVDYLMPQVVEYASKFRSVIVGDLDYGKPELKPDCKNCEYRVKGEKPSGFEECWGDMALVEPHILDIYYVSNLGSKDGFKNLVTNGQACALDVSESSIDGSKARGARQLRQIRSLRDDSEQVEPELLSSLRDLEYPLFFLDFETSRIPIPFHPGMNAYEQVVFQFSCHILRDANSTELEHREWINTENVYPNFEFASALENVLGDNGTILVWSPFEQTAMRDIVKQAEKYSFPDVELVAWLNELSTPTKEGGRVFDLMRLCESSYYHPLMQGRVSIKYVLKSIWQTSPSLWTDPWFAEYFERDENGHTLDPYQSLSAEPFGYESEREGVELEVVREGVGAMRAYQEMLYGLHRSDDEFKMVQRDLLLQYCKLDTAAMVIIWKYWQSLGS